MYQVERQVANNHIQEHLRLTKRHSCKFLRKKGKKDTKGEGEKRNRLHCNDVLYMLETTRVEFPKMVPTCRLLPA